MQVNPMCANKRQLRCPILNSKERWNEANSKIEEIVKRYFINDDDNWEEVILKET